MWKSDGQYREYIILFGSLFKKYTYILTWIKIFGAKNTQNILVAVTFG